MNASLKSSHVKSVTPTQKNHSFCIDSLFVSPPLIPFNAQARESVIIQGTLQFVWKIFQKKKKKSRSKGF
ncbi:hypothetical protein Bca4012_038681 [Brassica carinata]